MSKRRILLVEPKANNTYPPLGLMKFATYHKLKGDDVQYVIGARKSIADQFWDRIYITSVFTYDIKTLIKTIHCYSSNHANFPNIRVGGISATLLADEIEKQTNIKPHRGLQNDYDPFLLDIASQNSEFKYLLECDQASIDNLPPDYDIIRGCNKKHSKIIDNAYFFFSTKGCPNNCNFCAVNQLEPQYISYVPIKPRIEYIRRHFGDKAGLLLLDNNIAASDSYFRILDEIIDCGFGKGEKMRYSKNGRMVYKNRFVDFNQGVDLRLMNDKKMAKMAKIAIKPLRLAFDDIALEDRYENRMRAAIYYGIDNLSNYMLYNFQDKPEDLYKRFQVNMRILEDNKHVKIFSFPMRYTPIDQTDRKYVGKFWTKREIRAVQIVLNATHGIVSHKNKYFRRAFGKDLECYKRTLLYPYHYIINRDICEYNNMLIQQWNYDYSKLSKSEISEFKGIIKNGIMKVMPTTRNKKIRELLQHYEGEYALIKQDKDFINGHF